jgi:hypothetical protein
MRRASILATLLAAGLAALLIPALAGASTPSWHTYRISHAGDLATVRCPSSSVCVALSHAGQILTTKNAGAARPTWKLTAGLKVMGPEEDSEQRVAYNLSCPSVHLCVTSYLSKIITTTNPTGPASAWHAVDVQPAGLNAEGKIDSLTCPSVSLCVAGMNEWSNEEGGGTSLMFATSTAPGGAASAWTVFSGPPFVDYLTQLACSPGRVCAGGDDGNSVIASINPTGGSANWSRVTNLSSQLVYTTCPSISLCVGADFDGRLAYSISPAGSAWHQAKLPSGRYLTSVSCAGTSFCAATGGDSRHVTAVLTSTQPKNASRYSLHTFSARGDRLNAITCRSSSLCVAVGDDGLVAVLRRGA